MKTIEDLDFSVSKEIEKYTAHSAEIAIMICNFMSSKDMNKKTFSDLVGKTASDVTRWVSGNHNFTILTISLIEARTDLSIIKSLSKKNIIDYRKSNVFEVDTELILCEKNKILREEVEALRTELIFSKIKKVGVYKEDETYGAKSLLTGREKSTFRLKTSDIRKIKSKGNNFFAGNISYSD